MPNTSPAAETVGRQPAPARGFLARGQVADNEPTANGQEGWERPLMAENNGMHSIDGFALRWEEAWARYAGPKARILEAAATLMAERGYAGTSMRAIARAAGMTQSNLYNHFQSKEDVLYQGMGIHNSMLGEVLDEIRASSETPQRRLELGIRAYVSFRTNRSLRLRFADEMRWVTEAEKQEHLRVSSGHIRQALYDLVAACRDDRDEKEVFLVTTTIMQLIVRMHRWADASCPCSTEEIIRYLVAVGTGTLTATPPLPAAEARPASAT